MSTTEPSEKAQAACWRKLAFSLKEQAEMTWQQIADALNARGYVSAKGNALTHLMVQGNYARDRKMVLSAELSSECEERYQHDLAAILAEDRAEGNERGEQERVSVLSERELPSPQSMSKEPCRVPSPRSEPLTLDQITEHLTPVIRQIAMEVCESMPRSIPTVSHANTGDVPPEPETLKGTTKGGRRETREYEKISATVDRVLYKRFHNEQRERKCSTGRLLDIILWNYYGKPPLSYQLEGAEERALARPKRLKKTAKH